jgi:hypothetical protein
MLITRMITYKKAELSPPLMNLRLVDAADVAEAEIWCEFFKAFIPPNENCMEPMSAWFYPIIANRHIEDMKEFNGVKGMISSIFYWRNLIKDMLPPESKGIVLVFTNNCAIDSFTYQIDGPRVAYVSMKLYSTSATDCVLPLQGQWTKTT